LAVYEYRLFLTTLAKVQICELDIKDIDYSEFLTEPDELYFPLDKFLNGISQVEDGRFDLVKNLYWILLEKYSDDTLLSSKYFSIIEPTQSYDNGKVELKVKCMSIDYQEFNRRRIRGYDRPSVTLSDVLTYVSATPLYGTWTVGTLPSKATTEYHTVTSDDETITSFFQTLSQNWDVLILPDTTANVLNVYDKATYGSTVDIVLSTDNFVNSVAFSPKMDQLVTRLYLYGKDGIGISSVNPTGTSYIDDFSYFANAGYFSASLLGAYNLYIAKVASYGSSLASLLSTLTTKQSELLSIENDLVNLNAQKVIYDNAMSVLQSANRRETPDYTTVYNNWVSNNNVITAKEADKTTKEGEITSTLNSIYAINADLAYTNVSNFSAVQLQELSRFIYEQTLNIDTLDDAQLLYNYGVSYITARNEPIYEIDIDSVDLFQIAEAQNIRSLINVGDYVYLDLGKVSLDWVSLQVVSYSHNPFTNKLTFKLSNTSKLESSLYYLNDIFKKANATSNQVKNNATNWGEYSFDKPNLIFVDDEIDAETTIIRAGNGNTIDHRGFVGTDIGSDPNSHLKLMDDKIVITKDEWETYRTILSANGVHFTNAENTSRIVIDPDFGIQIDQNVAATPLSSENWDNRFYADGDGNLFIEGNIFVGDSAENVVIDRFGLDPSYAVWFKNMLPNTGSQVAQTPPIASPTSEFTPWMWTGCLSSVSATFKEGRSFKVAYGDTMKSVPAFEAAKCNPSTLPTGTEYMRFSWWSKYGQAQVQIKDETNSNYFSIAIGATPISVGTTTQTFSRKDNWYYSPDSVWFDLAESGHSGCLDIRVEITNAYSGEDLYINAPQLTIDRTGKWSQAYTAGPFSVATSDGSTVEGGGLDPSGGGGTIGNLYVETEFPTNAANKSVLVDTDDWSRYDKKDISTSTTLTVEDNEHVRCAGSSNYSVTLHTGATTATVIKYLVNVGTALVTVVGTINGQTNIYLYPGESCLLATNGTDWDQIG